MNITEKLSKEETTIADLIRPFTRNWYWFVITVIIGFFIAKIALKTTVPIYRTQTSILIKDAKSSTSSTETDLIKDLSGFSGMKTNSVDNEIEILKSKKLVQKVIEINGIQASVYTKNKFRSTELYGATSPIEVKVVSEENQLQKKPLQIKLTQNGFSLTSEELKKPITGKFGSVVSLPFAKIMVLKNQHYSAFDSKNTPQNELELVVPTMEDRVLAFQSKLGVALANKDVTVINLTLDYPEKQLAQDFLNSLLEVYNSDAIQDKSFESQKTLEFIDDRIKKLSIELGDVENQKESFKTANQITDLETEAKISLQTSAAAREKQLELETQYELLHSMLGFVQQQGKYQLLPSNMGISTQSSSGSIDEFNKLVLQRNRYLQNATPDNPIVVELTKNIDQLRNSVVQNLQKNIKGLDLARNEYIVEQNKVSGKIGKLPSIEKIFRGIERQQQIKENLYLLLLKKREEAAITSSITAPKARVIDKAYTSKLAVSPNPLFFYLAALLLGLGIPFAFIYIKNLLDTKIKTSRDIEKATNISVIGEVPKVKKKESDLVMQNDITPLAEAFRIIITNINFILKNKNKVVFVTSSVKGEGKTFVSVNLALTLANPKRKTIIVGADIRNPQLQRYNTARKGFLGLTEYLYDEDAVASTYIHPSTFNQNLDVIYSGMIPPNPTDLLSNNRFEVLLKELRSTYDYIIVDTAPLMLVTDTFLIAEHADITLYVSRSEYTQKKILQFAKSQAENGKLKNTQFVLNSVSSEYFGYGNKTGYGYTQDNTNWWGKLKKKFN